MPKPVDVPVLIVGGGPIGLSMAVGLRHFGLDCMVVEKHASTLDFPKGRRVTARTVARQVVSESGKLNVARALPLASVTSAGSHWMVSGNNFRTLG